MESQVSGRARLPRADLEFFRVFLPFELQLAQRRVMTWAASDELLARVALGLFLVRLETSGAEGGGAGLPATVPDHVEELLRSVLRESDIAGRLNEREQLAVVRDIDPDQAYVVAQRFLSAAGRSELLGSCGLRTRLGFVIYPLSSQPNFPADQWSTLLELARRMSTRGNPSGVASGLGVLRGGEAGSVGMPEADLVPLVFHDPESLVHAGILRLQRINILPAGQG